ncbi:hypothetical protein SLE2022_276390 [Rubroshorea leprosula]
MTPTNSTSTAKQRNSPLPYLFGGLGLMLLLITVALAMLACSFRKRSLDSPDSHLQEEISAKSIRPLPDAEPRIDMVVIMAGNNRPTYLATPVISDFEQV